MNHFLNRLFDAVDKAYTLNQTTINTYKANINIGRTNITTALSNISTIKQSIATQKVINQNNLTLAETQVSQADNTALQLRSNRGKSLALAQAQINDARSAVQNAKAQLELKESGTTTEQIDIQKAAIRQAEAATQIQQAQVSSAQASLNNAYVQLQKTVLKAPLSGAVTKQDAKVGQIVSPSISIVSLMSDSKFEIKTNIPEVDIAKVKIGHKAKITLDAYGSDVVFNATVVSIDPAETVIEGIATYLTTLIFDQTDQRVKPGMTANIDIRTDQRENVIVLPQRSIIDENGKKFVILLRDEEKTEKREVVTGLSASDGTIEIVSGLNEGDKVLIESEGVRF